MHNHKALCVHQRRAESVCACVHVCMRGRCHCESRPGEQPRPLLHRSPLQPPPPARAAAARSMGPIRGPRAALQHGVRPPIAARMRRPRPDEYLQRKALLSDTRDRPRRRTGKAKRKLLRQKDADMRASGGSRLSAEDGGRRNSCAKNAPALSTSRCRATSTPSRKRLTESKRERDPSKRM